MQISDQSCAETISLAEVGGHQAFNHISDDAPATVLDEIVKMPRAQIVEKLSVGSRGVEHYGIASLDVRAGERNKNVGRHYRLVQRQWWQGRGSPIR